MFLHVQKRFADPLGAIPFLLLLSPGSFCKKKVSGWGNAVRRGKSARFLPHCPVDQPETGGVKMKNQVQNVIPFVLPGGDVEELPPAA